MICFYEEGDKRWRLSPNYETRLVICLLCARGTHTAGRIAAHGVLSLERRRGGSWAARLYRAGHAPELLTFNPQSPIRVSYRDQNGVLQSRTYKVEP